MKEITLEKNFLNIIHVYEYPLWISMIIAIYISLLLATYLFVSTVFYDIDNASNQININIIDANILGQYNVANTEPLNIEDFLSKTYLINSKLSDNPVLIASDDEKNKIIAKIKQAQEKRHLAIMQKQNKYIMNGYSIITAYSSDVYQCDSTPCITANGFDVCKHGEMDTIAANHLKFGTKVKIPEIFGDKVFIVRDRMNRRYVDRIDIWMTSKSAAKQFGVKKSAVYIKSTSLAPVYFE